MYQLKTHTHTVKDILKRNLDNTENCDILEREVHEVCLCLCLLVLVTTTTARKSKFYLHAWFF